MAFWLVKSDPETYSWEMLLKDKKTNWDGVRNYQARNNLALMKKDELVLFYHSQENAKEIVGIAKVTKESFPDNTSEDPRWLAVELKAVKRMKNSVALSDIKKNPVLSNIGLIKQGRLSVMPVTEAEFNEILALSDTKI